MKITFMGTGTSHGIPMVGCSCPVCTSPNRKNKRTRSSLLISEKGADKPGSRILIDTATEFRLQAVREKLNHLDALFYTHAHADHLHGLDDIRPLTAQNPMPVYGSPDTLAELKEHYAYIFRETQLGGGKPRLILHPLQREAVSIGPWTVQPVPLFHGSLPVLGYIIGPVAYLTDCSDIPAESYPLLEGIRTLIIDGLRDRPHSTHFSIDQAREEGKKIGAEELYFTHLCHDIDHQELTSRFAGETSPSCAPAWDGLTLDMMA